MTETTAQIEARRSSLDVMHERLGAQMRDEGEFRVPASYGDAPAEYEAVRGGGSAGLIDLSSRGRIEVSGSEAVQFLNGMITNDVKALGEGAWMRAAFPNVQGRLIAEARVVRLASERFLFDMEGASRARVLQTLERFTLAGDFRVADLSDALAQISVEGARSADIIKATLGEEAARVERGRVATIEWNDKPLRVIRSTVTGEDGFALFVAAEDAVSLWESLAARGAHALGHDALEVLRIEAGVSRYGVDVDETNVVLEAVPDDAVSYTKGCYVGQEIIARIHWRGHVAKKLTGLSFNERVEARRGDKVMAAEGREIGRLTSIAFSPRLNRTIALGYVKYDYLTPGTDVRVLSGEAELTARVTELPHVRGSWYGEPEAAASEAQS